MDLFSDIEEPRLPFAIAESISYSCAWDTTLQAFILNIPNGKLIYSERFLDRKVSDRSVEYFQENDTLDWADRKSVV